MNKNNIKLLNRNNFHIEKCEHKGQYEFKRGLFLLHFEEDPEAQKEGLLLLKKSAKMKYQPAIDKIDEIKNKNLYVNARKMYKFVYGKDVI